MSLVYLLDTNIVSELARHRPDAGGERRVLAGQQACALAAVTGEELAFGVARLPAVQKREHQGALALNWIRCQGEQPPTRIA